MPVQLDQGSRDFPNRLTPDFCSGAGNNQAANHPNDRSDECAQSHVLEEMWAGYPREYPGTPPAKRAEDDTHESEADDRADR
jgi:hypothetical protein